VIAQTVRSQIIEGVQQTHKLTIDAAQAIAKTTSALLMPELPAFPGVMSVEAAPNESTDEAPGNLLRSFIRAQRQFANLSLRQLSALAEVSNPYLSQVERGLHEPSLHVLRSIAEALNVSTETLLEYAGLIDHDETAEEKDATDRAIRSDRRLTEAQRTALLEVYRGLPRSQRVDHLV